MMAGFGYWSRDFGGLYRDPENGRVAGVCAGLGAHFGIRPKALRIGLVIGSIFGFFLPILIGYGLLTLLLPPLDRTSAAGPASSGTGVWTGRGPAASAAELEERFRQLEARLVQVEETVTSKDFQLRQQFRNL
jgi:phage shock protein C